MVYAYTKGRVVASYKPVIVLIYSERGTYCSKECHFLFGPLLCQYTPGSQIHTKLKVEDITIIPSLEMDWEPAVCHAGQS